MASSASAAAEPRALSSWLTRPNLNPSRGGVAAGGVFVKKADDYSMLAAYFAAQRPLAAGAASATDAMDVGAGGRADDAAAASTATAEVPAPPQVRQSALLALKDAFGSSSAASRGLKALYGYEGVIMRRKAVAGGADAFEDRVLLPRDLIEPVALLGAVYVLSKSVRASRQQLVIAFSEHFDVSAQNQALAVTAAALETCFDHVGGSVTRAMVLAVHAIEERTELQRELLDKLLPVDWPRVFRTMPGKGSLRRACILRKEHLQGRRAALAGRPRTKLTACSGSPGGVTGTAALSLCHFTRRSRGGPLALREDWFSVSAVRRGS